MNGAAAPVTAAGSKPRRLVLHFDINKTIVMKDTTNNLNNATLTVSFYKKLKYFFIGLQHPCQFSLGQTSNQEGRCVRGDPMGLCFRSTLRDQTRLAGLN